LALAAHAVELLGEVTMYVVVAVGVAVTVLPVAEDKVAAGDQV